MNNKLLCRPMFISVKSLSFFVTLLLSTCNNLLSQVNIQPSIPAVGIIQKNQFWNLLLTNTTSKSLDGRIDLILRDNQSGLEIMTATTHRFTLPKGTLQTNPNFLSPIQYSYLGITPDNAANSVLAIGSYTACFAFTQFDGDAVEVIAEECVDFEVESLSPPLLNFPADSSIIDRQPSQFVWIPPGPAGIIKRLQYDIIIAEIKPSQQAAEALQENIPFFSSSSLKINYLSYQASMPKFKQDVRYAWQIVARDGEKFAGKSEVWSFELRRNDSSSEEAVSTSFLELQERTEIAGVHTTDQERLNVKFHSFAQTEEVKVNFLDQNARLIKSEKAKLEYGDNFLSFSLGRRFKAGQTYLVEIIRTNNKSIKGLFTTK